MTESIAFKPNGDAANSNWETMQENHNRLHAALQLHNKAALFDAFGTPYSVCRPPRPGTRHTMTATVAMIVMQPVAGEMDVAPMPALNRVFTRYSLHHEPFANPGLRLALAERQASAKRRPCLANRSRLMMESAD